MLLGRSGTGTGYTRLFIDNRMSGQSQRSLKLVNANWAYRVREDRRPIGYHYMRDAFAQTIKLFRSAQFCPSNKVQRQINPFFTNFLHYECAKCIPNIPIP